MKNPNKIYSVETTKLKVEGVETPITTEVKIQRAIAGAPDDIRDLYKIVASGSPDQKDIFDIHVSIPEHQRKPDVPLHFTARITNMDKYIEDLKHRYRYGRYAIYTSWKILPGVYFGKLNYRTVKSILRWERYAARFLDEKHIAIKEADPRLIKSILDCGLYAIEQWWKGPDRNKYQYVTYDSKMNTWIQNMKE